MSNTAILDQEVESDIVVRIVDGRPVVQFGNRADAVAEDRDAVLYSSTEITATTVVAADWAEIWKFKADRTDYSASKSEEFDATETIQINFDHGHLYRFLSRPVSPNILEDYPFFPLWHRTRMLIPKISDIYESDAIGTDAIFELVSDSAITEQPEQYQSIQPDPDLEILVEVYVEFPPKSIRTVVGQLGSTRRATFHTGFADPLPIDTIKT